MLADEVVFTVDREPFRRQDVILAAVRWGDWRDVERRALHGAACAKHAEAIGESLPAGAMDGAGREFRYAHDLITASSMEEWLRRWGLTIKDWTGYLRRGLLRSRYWSQLAALAARYPVPDEEARWLTVVDAICSGDLERWSRKLAGRAAVNAPVGAGAGKRTETDARTTPGGSMVVPDLTNVAALSGVDVDSLRESAERVERVEAAFERFRESFVTDRAVQEHVSARQLDWVRFVCRLMAFKDEGMAAEAALLLREDDEGFTNTYRAAHTEPRDARFFLDQIDASIRDHFLGARAGDLVGPLRVDGEFVLYLIQEKILPNARDPEVRRRAEEGVLKQALDRQLEGRVRWHTAH